MEEKQTFRKIRRAQSPTDYETWGGCDTYTKRDGTIGTAGKGALIQTDLASTLGVTQDQYLFEPMGDETDELSREDGDIEPGGASGKLQRTRCI